MFVLVLALVHLFISTFYNIALLWNAHGEMMSRCAQDKDMGFFSGIFFSILSISGILGNGIVGGILTAGLSKFVGFGVIFVLGCLGVVLLLLLRNVDKKKVVVEKVAASESTEHELKEDTVASYTPQDAVELQPPVETLDDAPIAEKNLLETRAVEPPKPNILKQILASMKTTVYMVTDRRMNLLQGMSLFTYDYISD